MSNAYGSEHSMNLVMIGHFKEARDADTAKQLIDRLTEQVNAEADYYVSNTDNQDRRFSDTMFNLLMSSSIHTIGPSELEQFAYDIKVHVAGNDVVVTTDEVEISAILKLLIEKGARIEVYSAHTYPGTGHGRVG